MFAGRPARPMAFWPRRMRSPGSSRSTEIADSGVRTSPSRISANAGRPFEPLERGRRRRPHRDLTGVHPGKGGARGQPGVPGHLARVDVEDRARGQLRGEEPGVEPAREGPRGRPARDLDKVVRPKLEPARPRRPPRTQARRGGRCQRLASRTPTSSQVSRIAAIRWATWNAGSSVAPRARRTSPGSASPGSTRPPGNTWSPAANAIESGRSVSRTSSPSGPGRTRTIVAAGRGSTGGVAVAVGRRRQRTVQATVAPRLEVELEAQEIDARLRLAVRARAPGGSPSARRGRAPRSSTDGSAGRAGRDRSARARSMQACDERAPDPATLRRRIDREHPERGLAVDLGLRVRRARTGHVGHPAEDPAAGSTATSTGQIDARRATSRTKSR